MADDRDLGPALRRRMTYLLKYALITLDELHEEHLAPVGVTPRELAVLLLLSDREPESQQQAAQRLGVDRTTMVGLLDGLQSKALVIRRADAADRRRNVVELTDAGRAALEKATHASDEAERQLLADLDETDSVSLRDLLTRIATGERAERTS
ncbi:MarR family transcriptional regulator [Nocardioides sp. 1609]|uniref:MarR family winged helix-turn-helix transcriptional regulator n=1 Tax=Nocardioides sp. 1609 TaxID=2508327 RepID=UPI00106FD520|nr:MarR family transcriptional regulator [Nocardioides sp. 1609]